MMRFLSILVVFVLLIAGVLIAAPSFIPVETYKPQISALVKEQTGRDLTINGDISLSFLPRLAVTVNDVTFSNASWASAPHMATMDSLEVVLQVLPLLKGEIALERFILVRPEIDLAVNRQGVGNWVFAPTSAPNAPQAPTEPGAADSGAPTIQNVQLGKIALDGGLVRYSDARSGAKYELSDIDLDVSLPSLDDALYVAGSLVWNGDKVSVDMGVANPRALSTGDASDISLKLDAPKVSGDFNGNASISPKITINGTSQLSIPSVRTLAAWAGQPLAPGGGLGALELKGGIAVNGDMYRFSDATLSFDGMNGTGDIAVDAGRARPKLTGTLALDRLDANTYLVPSNAADAGSAAPSGGTNGGGAASTSGWSDEPIDLSGLKAIDADLTLSAGELLFQEIKVGKSALAINLIGGKMTANLTQLDLYEGDGKGRLVLDGSGSVPSVAAKFDLLEVSAYPLLRDAAAFERLEGKGTIGFDVRTSGRSQKAMMSALGGSGAVTFANGAIRGINLAQLMRNVFSAATSGWDAGGSQSTDFSELGGTFTIAQGVLNNSDLKMLSPLIRITGKGTVNMPAQTLNYRVEPKLAATLEGQGGNNDVKGIEVPVIISGSWTDPKFTPDLAAVLANPEGIKDVIDSVKEDGGKGLLRGLLGGGSGEAPATDAAPSTAEPAPEPEKPDVKDALKGLFGR